jgi:cytochrome P450
VTAIQSIRHETAAVAPIFDAPRNAWLLSRFTDVSAALRETSLVAFGTTEAAAAVHESVRDAAARALAPSHAIVWQRALDTRADLLLHALPDDTPVDLMRRLFEPWSQYAARLVCGVGEDAADEREDRDAVECAELARAIWLAAATATDGAPRDTAHTRTDSSRTEPSREHSSVKDSEHTDSSHTSAPPMPALALAERLAQSRPGASAVADVQTFVALSETLPCALSGSWHALLQQPQCVAQLRASPGDMKAMMSEALRCASPSRAVFRVALRDATIADSAIRAGQQVILLLAAANHDPIRFPEPSTIDLTRAESGHLAFGEGVHRCAGASFVRLLLCTITAALLRRANRIALAELPSSSRAWRGGFAIGAPDALVVTLSR